MKKPDFFQGCGILTPTLDAVKHVDDYLLSLVQASEQEYISADLVCKNQMQIARYTVNGSQPNS
jgi:hypothetical protein